MPCSWPGGKIGPDSRRFRFRYSRKCEGDSAYPQQRQNLTNMGRSPPGDRSQHPMASRAGALCALSAPPMRRVVALSLGCATLTFALLWVAVAGVLYNAAFFEWRPAQLARRPDGRARGAGVELATFPGCRDGDHELFPRADCRDGRSSRLPRSRPTAPSANRRDDCVDIALTGLTLLLNLLALPVYLLVPGINLYFSSC
jgi:hypothetical protein